MPMDKRFYPANWPDIATAIKKSADWTCQECGRPCRRPKESNDKLFDRLSGSEWESEFEVLAVSGECEGDFIPKWGRFTLTVAHLNHTPSDCRPENLKALCSGCHCRYDLGQMPLKRRLKAERLGQLTLPVRGEA